MLIYVLCEVATVSQLCISFPYELHGLCEDYLTCDIAFNAVMPLSRASTRGRYSRIEGVTAFPLRVVPPLVQVELLLLAELIRREAPPCGHHPGADPPWGMGVQMYTQIFLQENSI